MALSSVLPERERISALIPRVSPGARFCNPSGTCIRSSLEPLGSSRPVFDQAKEFHLLGVLYTNER